MHNIFCKKSFLFLMLCIISTIAILSLIIVNGVSENRERNNCLIKDNKLKIQVMSNDLVSEDIEDSVNYSLETCISKKNDSAVLFKELNGSNISLEVDILDINQFGKIGFAIFSGATTDHSFANTSAYYLFNTEGEIKSLNIENSAPSQDFKRGTYLADFDNVNRVFTLYRKDLFSYDYEEILQSSLNNINSISSISFVMINDTDNVFRTLIDNYTIYKGNDVQYKYNFNKSTIDVGKTKSDSVNMEIYNDPMFKVQYVSEDGTLLKSQDVAYRGYMLPPDTPVKYGYDFIEWKGIENAKDVCKNVICVAVFKAQSPEVRVILNDEEEGNSIIGNGQYNVGDEINLKAIEGKKYLFKGWYYNNIKMCDDKNYDFIMPNYSLNLKAVFERAYIITLSDNLGNDKIIKCCKDSLVSINPPMINGYSFSGFDSEDIEIDEEIKQFQFTMPEKNININLTYTKTINESGKKDQDKKGCSGEIGIPILGVGIFVAAVIICIVKIKGDKII